MSRNKVSILNHEIKSFAESAFSFKRLLPNNILLCRNCSGNSFGDVQCDLKIPDNLEENIERYPPIFENTLVSHSDYGEFMKEYPKENNVLPQFGGMLISIHKRNDNYTTFDFLSEPWSLMYQN